MAFQASAAAAGAVGGGAETNTADTKTDDMKTRAWWEAYPSEVRASAISHIRDAFLPQPVPNRAVLWDLRSSLQQRFDINFCIKRYLFDTDKQGEEIDVLMTSITKERKIGANCAVIALLSIVDIGCFTNCDDVESRCCLCREAAQCVIEALLHRGLRCVLGTSDDCNVLIHCVESPLLAHALLDLPPEHGPNVNSRSHSGCTALISALKVTGCNVKLVQRLIQRSSESTLNDVWIRRSTPAPSSFTASIAREQQRPALLLAIYGCSLSDEKSKLCLSLLLEAANDDGTGVDLLGVRTRTGLTAVEYARSLDPKQSNFLMLVAIHELETHVKRVTDYQKQFRSILTQAIGEHFMSIRGLLEVVTTYVLLEKS